ncbi:sigma-70 family RNA polymerase sigma factor [Acetobacter okinawensis]|uniref:RNA polymerase sigma factor n=1 Tax=Acetobacter okinawensis TaxID=1076594 RepID=UPI001BA47021|nr:sigma-70 family RNA polymerase sigma factor [Acetobacter okinawensis]MBS0967125.1 sigma-70 family RNA polymerase sigma factor [Acetobacter okinawensis]
MTEGKKRGRLINSFEQHYQDLLRFLFRRTGDVEEAADLAHDTYVRLTNVADSIVENDKAYIFRVAGNLALDMHRRSGRRAVWLSDEEPGEGIADPQPSQEQHVIDQDRLAAMDAALSNLPPKARLALLMVRVDGLRYVEIAERLNISVSMVSKYVTLAVQHCRDHIRQDDE